MDRPLLQIVGSSLLFAFMKTGPRRAPVRPERRAHRMLSPQLVYKPCAQPRGRFLHQDRSQPGRLPHTFGHCAGRPPPPRRQALNALFPHGQFILQPVFRQPSRPLPDPVQPRPPAGPVSPVPAPLKQRKQKFPLELLSSPPWPRPLGAEGRLTDPHRPAPRELHPMRCRRAQRPAKFAQPGLYPENQKNRILPVLSRPFLLRRKHQRPLFSLFRPTARLPHQAPPGELPPNGLPRLNPAADHRRGNRDRCPRQDLRPGRAAHFVLRSGATDPFARGSESRRRIVIESPAAGYSGGRIRPPGPMPPGPMPKPRPRIWSYFVF